MKYNYEYTFQISSLGRDQKYIIKAVHYRDNIVFRGDDIEKIREEIWKKIRLYAPEISENNFITIGDGSLRLNKYIISEFILKNSYNKNLSVETEILNFISIFKKGFQTTYIHLLTGISISEPFMLNIRGKKFFFDLASNFLSKASSNLSEKIFPYGSLYNSKQSNLIIYYKGGIQKNFIHQPHDKQSYLHQGNIDDFENTFFKSELQKFVKIFSIVSGKDTEVIQSWSENELSGLSGPSYSKHNIGEPKPTDFFASRRDLASAYFLSRKKFEAVNVAIDKFRESLRFDTDEQKAISLRIAIENLYSYGPSNKNRMENDEKLYLNSKIYRNSKKFLEPRITNQEKIYFKDVGRFSYDYYGLASDVIHGIKVDHKNLKNETIKAQELVRISILHRLKSAQFSSSHWRKKDLENFLEIINSNKKNGK